MLASRFPLSSAASPTQNPSPPPDRLRRHLRPPLNHFPRPPLLSSPPRSSDSSHLLKHYGRLASNLAASGRLQGFLMIAASILTSDELSPGRPQFMIRIHTGMIAKGIASVLRDGGVKEVLDFLRGADKLGICSEEMFNKSAKDVLAAVCGRLVEEGRLEEFVGLIETLAGEAVKDDMIIIAGNVKESTKSASYNHEVQQAIIEVLQDELGLDVIATGHGSVLRGEQTERH